MRFKIKRLWHGAASVRDYVVEEAKKKNIPLTIVCKNEIMTIPPDKLSTGKVSKFIIASKHDGRQYRLVDFKWKPDVVQQNLI